MTGATRADWATFDLVLGLGQDLLPVVPDPSAKPAADSKVKQFGKIPSAYNQEGQAYGLSKWTTRDVTSKQLKRWSEDERLGLCLRTGRSGVYAFDIDVEDEFLADAITYVIESRVALPRRERANSAKALYMFALDDRTEVKRIINTAGGRVEMLGLGQQFVCAGQHPSGARYEWRGGVPDHIPTLAPELFEDIWCALHQYIELPASLKLTGTDAGTQPKDTSNVEESKHLTTIDAAQAHDLEAALRVESLVAAAASYEVWSDVGIALLSLGNVGRDLFAAFSVRAPNGGREAALEWWEANSATVPKADFRHIFTLARAHGWRPEIPEVSTAEAFPLAEPPTSSLPAPLIEDPLLGAEFQDTDASNADRMINWFVRTLKLTVARGSFYVWDNYRWVQSENEAHGYAGRLSKLIKATEITPKADALKTLLKGINKDQRELFEKATDIERRNRAASKAVQDVETQLWSKHLELERLRAWQHQCEMARTQNAAVSILRSRDQRIEFDADRHLLNCTNGIIDLHTGMLWPHDPARYITKVTGAVYDPRAECQQFDAFMLSIMGGDVEMVQFLQRWFGYCATGDVSEQKMVLHIGAGANGKSTLVNLVDDVLGDYAITAAPTLLAAANNNSERHPTELADLAGARMVTASESDEGNVLKEALVKRLTGSDPIKGRLMREDFFEFLPTHKLQMLTNHTPTVRGQEHAMWRRLLLVRYDRIFGTQEDLDAGRAQGLRDNLLPERLATESSGILNWLVNGAVEWRKQGLNPPASVKQASERYRKEQDRVAQFIAEKCTLEPGRFSRYVTSSGEAGILTAFQRWARENGYYSFGRERFRGDMERTTNRTVYEDRLKDSTLGLNGIRLNFEEDGYIKNERI